MRVQRRQHRTTAAPVAAVALACVALVGCSAETSTDGGTAPSSASPESTGSPGSSEPSGDATSGPGLPTVTVPEGPYLPTPFGVTLDEPGTERALGEEAVVAWTPQEDEVGVLGLRVLRLEETTLRRSFAGFELGGVADDAVPYLVTARVQNLGETELGGRVVPLFAQDSRGRLVEATPVPPDFPDCPGGALPARFAPEDQTRTCQVYLVPDGADLEGVAFVPPAPTEPLTWTGAVEPLGGGR